MRLFKTLAILSLVFLTVCNLQAQNQVRIRLHQPPPNQLGIKDLWKLDITKTRDHVNIYLTGTATESKTGLIVSGKSKVFSVSPGTNTYSYEDFKRGEVNWIDKSIQEVILRTGSVPEGEYTICVTAFGETGEVLGIENCISQTVVITSQAQLILVSPEDGAELSEANPTFIWQIMGVRQKDATYDLKIVEVRSGQTPEGAIKTNTAVVEKHDLKESEFRYSESNPKLENGKRYAWEVKSGNIESEVGKFTLIIDTLIEKENFPTILTGGAAIVLEGTIVTPQTVIPHGWVIIRNGIIENVFEVQPRITNAIEIQTHGIIYPGLIDLHNHVSWNVFPCWQPGHKFNNRYDWHKDPDYNQLYNNPLDSLTSTKFKRDSKNKIINFNLIDHTSCDMNTYGEIRSLIGGTTSILGAWKMPCIHGLVRNLDYASGFYGKGQSDMDHIGDEIFLHLFIKDTIKIKTLQTQLSICDTIFKAFVIHIAEGTDDTSRKEFDSLDLKGLLTSKTVIVHGIALGETEFKRMQTVGASMVWSPHSNETLYGQTLDLPLAIKHNIPIALAPDWTITGSNNMLDELRYAAEYVRYMQLHLSDTTLVEMATINPAVIAGIDTKVGTIQKGLRADLLVIAGDPVHPYRSLLEAKEADVELVLIDGVPIYGDSTIMSQYWKTTVLSIIPIGGKSKALKMKGDTFNDLKDRLTKALHELDLLKVTDIPPSHITLAPLIEDCNPLPENLLMLNEAPQVEGHFNPFNKPETKINFDIPSNDKSKMSNVNLVIYNTLGQEVATLINEQLIPGSHEVEWNTSNLQGGMYFYKIISNNCTVTKKIMIVK